MSSEFLDFLRADYDPESELWQPLDYKMGKCSLGDVGRPKPQPDMTKAGRLARKHVQPAIDTLVEIARDPKQDANARIKAASALIDRGYGKAMERMQAQIDQTVTVVAPWMAPDRLSYQRAEEVIDVTPTTTTPTSNEVAEARQAHLDAERAARDKQKAIDAHRAGSVGPHPDPATRPMPLKAVADPLDPDGPRGSAKRGGAG